MDRDSLFFTPEHKVDTIHTPNLHVYILLDPMDTIWAKGVHVYDHLEVVATATSGGALAAAGGGM
jgi:hypothetical protein